MNTMQSQLRDIHNAYTSHNNPAAKQYIYFWEVLYKFLHQTSPSLPFDYKHHCDEGDISWLKTQARWGWNQESMVEGTCTSFLCSLHISNTVNEKNTDIPWDNEIQYLWMFMNSAVIHDDHRIWRRIWIHVVQDTSNKRIKSFRTKRTFNNVTMDNSIVKRKCRQNRESR